MPYARHNKENSPEMSGLRISRKHLWTDITADSQPAAASVTSYHPIIYFALRPSNLNIIHVKA